MNWKVLLLKSSVRALAAAPVTPAVPEVFSLSEKKYSVALMFPRLKRNEKEPLLTVEPAPLMMFGVLRV